MTDESTEKLGKEYEAGAEILRQLRSQGFSYGDAYHALNYAQTLLQKMERYELNLLPIADGTIEARFNPDNLVLSSSKIADKQSVPNELAPHEVLILMEKLKESSKTKDGSDWIMVCEGDNVCAFRKSGSIAVVPDSVYLDHSNVVVGGTSFRFKGDVRTVLRDVLDVDITAGTPPKQVVSVKAPIDWHAPRIDIATGKPLQQ